MKRGVYQNDRDHRSADFPVRSNPGMARACGCSVQIPCRTLLRTGKSALRRQVVKLQYYGLAFTLLFSSASAATVGGKPPPKVPAFPGAEGAGAITPGGRGGKVFEVTTLTDGGPGSLREAFSASGPRIVVFRVSGL